jgi:hypothetical protein
MLKSVSTLSTRLSSNKTATLVFVIVSALPGCAATTLESEKHLTNYQNCVKDAWLADDQAHKINGEAKYLLSAKIFSRCDMLANTNSILIQDKDRMITVAMASLNYARGGNIGEATEVLRKFEVQFPSKDLYLSTDNSFVDAMRIITSYSSVTSSHIRLLNVNNALRNEMMNLNN